MFAIIYASSIPVEQTTWLTYMFYKYDMFEQYMPTAIAVHLHKLVLPDSFYVNGVQRHWKKSMLTYL